MTEDKSSISKARSYAEIGEFWDEHGLSDFWKKTKKVKFDVVLEPEATYYLVEVSVGENPFAGTQKGFPLTLWSICGWSRKSSIRERDGNDGQ